MHVSCVWNNLILNDFDLVHFRNSKCQKDSAAHRQRVFAWETWQWELGSCWCISWQISHSRADPARLNSYTHAQPITGCLWLPCCIILSHFWRQNPIHNESKLLEEGLYWICLQKYVFYSTVIDSICHKKYR